MIKDAYDANGPDAYSPLVQRELPRYSLILSRDQQGGRRPLGFISSSEPWIPMPRLPLAGAAVIGALTSTLALAQVDPLSLLGPARDFDLNGTPGRATLAELKKHYGSRLKASNYLCSLPQSAALRQPTAWDCTVWHVDKPRYFLVPVDSLQYRTLPDGTVVSESYGVDGNCERALTAFFSIASIYSNQPAEQAGYLGSEEDAMGSIKVQKRFKSPKFEVDGALSLELRGRKCTMFHSMEIAK